jgi:hypothetical protein
MKWRPSNVSQEALQLGIELAQQEVELDPAEGAEEDATIPDDVEVYVDPQLVGYDISNHPQLSTSGLRSVFDVWLDSALDEHGCDDLHELFSLYQASPTRFHEEDAIYLFILEAWKDDQLSELPPIAVRQTGTILDGWHRLVVAASKGQVKDIPAIVVRW